MRINNYLENKNTKNANKKESLINTMLSKSKKIKKYTKKEIQENDIKHKIKKASDEQKELELNINFKYCKVTKKFINSDSRSLFPKCNNMKNSIVDNFKDSLNKKLNKIVLNDNLQEKQLKISSKEPFFINESFKLFNLRKDLNENNNSFFLDKFIETTECKLKEIKKVKKILLGKNY